MKYLDVISTSLTDNSATPKETLGAVFFTGGKGYIYGQLSSGCAAAGSNGCTYVWETLSSYIFTNDISEGNAGNGNTPAGVGIGTLTSNYYGWIQIRGDHSAIATDGGDDVVTGQVLIIDADGTTNAVSAGTAPTYIPLGVSSAADVDASNTVAGVILVPIM